MFRRWRQGETSRDGNQLHRAVARDDVSAVVGLIFSVEREGLVLRSPNPAFKDVVLELDHKGIIRIYDVCTVSVKYDIREVA